MIEQRREEAEYGAEWSSCKSLEFLLRGRKEKKLMIRD
jgi:hypothetical protein